MTKRYRLLLDKLLQQMLFAFIYGVLGAGSYAYYDSHREKWELAALIEDLAGLGSAEAILVKFTIM